MVDSRKRYLPKIGANYLYVIISVALVLFLMGFFGAAVVQTNDLIGHFKEQVNIIVELEDAAATNELNQFREMILESAYLKDSSLQFISKEQGATMLNEALGEDLLRADLPNPLYNVFIFNVKSAYLVEDSLSQIRKSLLHFSFVSDVYYQESLINELARNFERIGYLAFGVSIFFVIIAVVLMHNTIRLALYSNRFLIKNMELVGASWQFISRPYLLKSMLYGLMSSGIAIAALSLLLWFLTKEVEQISLIESVWKIILLFIGLIFIGVLITTLSTYYVVNKYLKMRVDDLY
ncbi:MAG: hypothetical protein HC892_03195 [Saprospiraceae bacterium]|nr:hypothetical protein [Saprospiraceae bacterium]